MPAKLYNARLYPHTNLNESDFLSAAAKEVGVSNLHITTQGQGRPLVVLHGWGMNSHVWQPVHPSLSALARVSLIDLPGHGGSTAANMGTLEHTVQQLAGYIPHGALVMGWSLGGLIAQALAHAYPEKVGGLILVGSTPKFVSSPAWAHGVAPDVLDMFARNLKTDYLGTVKRFFALQFLSTKTDTKVVNALRDTILSHPATSHALADGLEILRTADFSTQAPKHPTLWLLGKLDKLIPASLAEALPELGYKREQIVVMPNAAHVPFVTHSELFLDHVRAFLHAH